MSRTQPLDLHQQTQSSHERLIEPKAVLRRLPSSGDDDDRGHQHSEQALGV